MALLLVDYTWTRAIRPAMERKLAAASTAPRAGGAS